MMLGSLYKMAVGATKGQVPGGASGFVGCVGGGGTGS